MKEIIKYNAIDNTLFDTKKECLKYEALLKKVNIIMILLSPTPKGDNCSFINGGGFLQHDEMNVKKVKREILKLCKGYNNHEWIQKTIDDETTHPSYVGRLLDGSKNFKPLDRAWSRFMCIDKLYREWGQIYFAEHPDQGEQTCLNT